MEISEEKVKELLIQQGGAQRTGEPVYEWMQRRRKSGNSSVGVEVGVGAEVPIEGGGSRGGEEQPDCLIPRELCEAVGRELETQKCCQSGFWRCSPQKPHYLKKRTREVITCYSIDSNGRRVVRSRWAHCQYSWSQVPTVDCCTELGCDSCSDGVDRLCKKNGRRSATD